MRFMEMLTGKAQLLALTAGLIALIVSSSAFASEHIITQQGEKFSELFLKISHNDIVKFINQDEVKHKLLVSYKSKSHAFQELTPGKSQAIEFNKSGLYDIECEIHDKMKLTVFVPHIVKVGVN